MKALLALYLFYFTTQCLADSLSVIEQGIHNEELNSTYGRIIKTSHRYCVGLEVVVIERVTLLDFYYSSYLYTPLFFDLFISGHNIKVIKGDFPMSSMIIDKIEQKKFLSIEITRPTFSYDWVFSCHLGPKVTNYDRNHIYELPFEQGKSFKVTQGYGDGRSHHAGQYYAVDWDLIEGTPVLAARDGVVIATRDDITLEGKPKDRWDSEYNYVYLLHKDGSVARYIHLKPGSIVVRVGETVLTGQKLSRSGNTGNSSGPHLHFDVKIPGQDVYFKFPYRINAWVNSIGVPLRFNTAKGVIKKIRKGQVHTRP